MTRGVPAPRWPLRLLLLAFTAAPLPAAAHSRPLSYSFLHAHAEHGQRGERVDVRLQIAPADLALLGFDLAADPAQSGRAGQWLQRGLSISAGQVACAPLAPKSTAAAPNSSAERARLSWMDCMAPPLHSPPSGE